MTLEGRRVLVTGATGKLGRGVVPVLLNRGAHVLATFRSEEKLSALMEACKDAEAPMQAFPCDVTDMGQVAGLATRVLESGTVDALVCLAGGWSGGHAFWDGPPGELEAQMRLNTFSAANVIRAFVPGMVESGTGRVVTVGSRIAVKVRKGSVASAASKAALISLTEGLAEELAGTGVDAFCLLPATVATVDEAEALAAAHRQWTTPERIGRVITWLLDDDAAIANGAVIPVYGD